MPTLQPTDLNISLAVLSLYVCGFGLISYVVKHRLYISEALVALLFGIIVGPHVTGWVDPRTWTEEHLSPSGSSNYITMSIMRIAICIQVLFAGISLPHKYLKIEARSLLILLVGYMVAGWLTCGFLIYELIPGLTYMESLLIAACITPTDPVLASSITKGRFAEEDVDPAVRHLILAESGSNDGLGYPFIYLPLYWFAARSEEPFPVSRSLGGVIGRWIYDVWIYDVFLSIVFGVVVGYIARKTLRFAEQKQWLDEDNFLAYGMGLAFFCLGFMGILGSDDLLASFVAGVAFSWDDRQRQLHEDESVHDIIDTLVNAAVFVYIGAIMSFDTFGTAALGMGTWRLVVLAICVLLFRRLPWVTLLHWVIPALRNWRHGVFVGWFGPIGVSAIFYVSYVLEHLPEPRHKVHDLIEPVVFFIVLSSVIVHGVSVPAHKGIYRSWDAMEARFFPHRYARYQAEKKARDAELRAAEDGEHGLDGHARNEDAP